MLSTWGLVLPSPSGTYDITVQNNNIDGTRMEVNDKFDLRKHKLKGALNANEALTAYPLS